MDTALLNSFYDELEKISESAPDNTVDKDRLKRFARYGLAAAAAGGVGYATGKLVARPIGKALVNAGMSRPAANVLKYLVPTTAALGAGYGIARKRTTKEIHKRVRRRE